MTPSQIPDPDPDVPHGPRPAVLVTGGAGFVGAALVRALLGRGARVVVADDLSSGDRARLPLGAEGLVFHPLDVSAPGGLTALYGEQGPFDAVAHLAAVVGVAAVLADPESCRARHLAAARELAAAQLALPPRERPRVVAASTSEVYREAPGPLAEGHPTRPLDGVGRWAYAASKLAVERLLDVALGPWLPGRGPLHLRLFNVVGPGQDAGGGMVLPTFVEHALAGEPLPVHGDGGALRTFAHVEDVAADVAELCLRRTVPGGPLNLGGTARTTISALAREVLRAAGSSCGVRPVDPRRAVSRRFEEVRRREPDLARARALGLARRTRSLRAIVADALARHPRGLGISGPRR